MKIQFGSSSGSDSGGPTSVAGKGCATLFLAVFAAFGIGFTVVLLGVLWKIAVTYTWPKADCVILDSRVNENTEKGDRIRFEVKYEYTVGGVRHTSEVYEHGYSGSGSYADEHRLADQYKPGSRAVCYVNPNNADDAILKRKVLWLAPFIILPLIFVAVGVGGIYYIWKRKKTRPNGRPAGPISAKAKGAQNMWLLVAFFAVFFLAGCGVFYGMCVLPLIRAERAKGWIETPCEVISSSVRSHSGDDSTTYSVDILYKYTVNGREYKSNRHNFFSGSTSGYEGKKRIVDAHPPGRKTVCYVDPDDAREAVLTRKLGGEMWFGLIPLVFVAVGGGGMFFTVRSILRRRAAELTGRTEPAGGIRAGRAEQLDSTRAGGQRAARRTPIVAPVASGPVTLKPKQSPAVKLIGVIFFAAIWNGVVSVFVFQIVKGWATGHGDWFETIFLIPFVASGLGAIGGILYYFLALWNPRPKLTVSPGAVSLGGKAELKWELTGSTGRIGKLEMLLEGREEATYQNGKNTSTEKKVFATLPVATVEDPREMVTGAAAFTVPADTMHSFKARNNKIVWTVKVHGDIALWPDVKEEFELTVLPAPLPKDEVVAEQAVDEQE